MRWIVLLSLVLVANDTPDRDAAWLLVWSDEFDTPGRPDPDKWTYEEGFVRNRELQYYTRDRAQNARLEEGMLVIEARRERFANPDFRPGASDWRRSRQHAAYTSASLTTKGKASWTYGRIEVRAKLPTGRGAWPAIWTLGANIDSVGWPRCGEIDIMENVGFDPDRIHGTVHTRKYNHIDGTHKKNTLLVPRPYDHFHVYAIDWSEERIDFFVDGKKYFTFANDGQGQDTWPFDRDHYLLVNVAIGGDWGGQMGVDDTIFPQKMLIDWVRVYRRQGGK